MNKYSYVFVREDLPNTVKLVQSSHACMEMAFVTRLPEEQTFLVALSVKDEKDLKKIADKLEHQKIKFSIFFEPDFDYGYTALCTEPVEFGKYKVFEKYNLLEL
jgi:phage-related protein